MSEMAKRLRDRKAKAELNAQASVRASSDLCIHNGRKNRTFYEIPHFLAITDNHTVYRIVQK